MMTTGHELKLGRADHHFRDVQTLRDTYLNPQPYEIRREENPDTGLSFWITLREKPPDDIALAAGDAIHNMRSALDHLIYEISCRRWKKHVARTGFPVLIDKEHWDGKGADGRLKKGSGLHQIRALPKAAREFIELVQPYKGANPMHWQRERLFRLHQLDIADKHRNLNVAFANIPDIGVGFGHDGLGQLPVTYVHQGGLEESTETLLLRFHPSVDLKVNVYPTAFLEVVFTGPWPTRAGGSCWTGSSSVTAARSRSWKGSST